MANITAILIYAYAMESATLQAEKVTRGGKNVDNAKDMAVVFAR